MAEKIILNAEKRELTGKKARALRKEGIVPGVIYGAKLAATNVQFAPVALQKALAKAGRHSTIEIDLDGKKHTALVKSVEYAPARSNIVHVSFQAVSANEEVTTEVPLVLTGVDESEAKKAGLVILPTVESVEIRAKASDLIDKIEADASKLTAAEEKLTLSDAKIPATVEVVDFDPELVIATVWEPAALEAKNNGAVDNAVEAEADTAEATPVAADASAEK